MARQVTAMDPEEIDWGRPESLVRFALVARVDWVSHELGWSRSDIAERMGLSASGLHERLSLDGLTRASAVSFVQDLQRFLQVAEAQLGRSGSELVAFHQAITNSADLAGALRVPATFFDPLNRAGPSRNEEEVLVRGAALFGIRQQAFNLAEAERLRRRYGGAGPVGEMDQIEATMDELVTLAALPRQHRTLAVVLAADLQDWVLPVVERHLHASPVGWRSPQIFTRMLRLNEDRIHNDRIQVLFERIRDILSNFKPERVPNPDPGRVFIEEALRRTPGERRPTRNSRHLGPYATWAWAWVPERLERIARDDSLGIRQRSYAALCLLRRDDTFARAEDVIRQMRNESETDATGGLAYATSVLDTMLQQRAKWTPDAVESRQNRLDRGVSAFATADAFRLTARHFSLDQNRPDRSPVLEALGTLAPTVRNAAQFLILESLLSIDATRRRTACDTLIAAGAADEATAVIGMILESNDAPPFLVETAAVVLGYLGDPAAVPWLTRLALSSQSSAIQTAALIALGEVNVEESPVEAEARLTTLSARSRDTSPQVVYASTMSLATMSSDGVQSHRSRVLADIEVRADLPDHIASLSAWGLNRLRGPATEPPPRPVD